jgi:hypothetical protein
VSSGFASLEIPSQKSKLHSDTYESEDREQGFSICAASLQKQTYLHYLLDTSFQKLSQHASAKSLLFPHFFRLPKHALVPNINYLLLSLSRAAPHASKFTQSPGENVTKRHFQTILLLLKLSRTTTAEAVLSAT